MFPFAGVSGSAPMKVIVVESIILLIIILDVGVESGPAHFCSTVQLYLLFLESSFLHHKVMTRRILTFVVAAVFLHACAFDLISVLQNSTPRVVWSRSV